MSKHKVSNPNFDKIGYAKKRMNDRIEMFYEGMTILFKDIRSVGEHIGMDPNELKMKFLDVTNTLNGLKKHIDEYQPKKEGGEVN